MVFHVLAPFLDNLRWVYAQRTGDPAQGRQLHRAAFVAPADGVDAHPAHLRQLLDGDDTGVEHCQSQLAFADSHFLLALLSILWYVVGNGLVYPYYIPGKLNLSTAFLRVN